MAGLCTMSANTTNPFTHSPCTGSTCCDADADGGSRVPQIEDVGLVECHCLLWSNCILGLHRLNFIANIISIIYPRDLGMGSQSGEERFKVDKRF